MRFDRLRQPRLLQEDPRAASRAGDPYHYHKLKEETFQVLWGEIHLDIDGQERRMVPGDSAVVLPGAWHKFRTDKGCVVEEISTTHKNDDSIYKDPAINRMAREERKTVVKHWGRFEII